MTVALARAGNSPDSMHGTDALASAVIGPASHEAGNREGEKMTNDRLRAAVAAELSWDPKVDSKDITVSAERWHGEPARHGRERPAKTRGR
jgi:hypothetical protein